MTETTTYSGASLELVEALPAAYDQAGYEALTFVGGECALHEVPMIGREWSTVTEDLVCQRMNVDKKGGYKYPAVSFKLSRKPGDAAQAIYQALEADDDVGSFKLALPNSGGTIYMTAQVSKFTLVDGGSSDTIHTSSVELLLQSDPVFVAAA